MQVTNRYTNTPVYWRMFDPGDRLFWAGRGEGVAQPGQNIGPLNHPSGSFKLELKQNGVFGPFIAAAGPIIQNDEEYVLEDSGRFVPLSLATPDPATPTPPTPPPTPQAFIRRITGFNARGNGFPFPNFFNRTSFPVQEIAGFPITADAFGLCGGMVYAACDYFLAGMPVPGTATPPVGGPLFDYLWRRLIDSFNLPFGAGNPARYLQLMSPALADAGPPDFLGVRPRMNEMIQLEWPRIQATIDDGRLCPIAFVYWKSSDTALLFNNHQVLVYGYELRRSLVTLIIYDPNSPEIEQTLSFDTAQPNVHTVMYSGPLNPGARVWSFFATDYSFVAPPDASEPAWDSGWRSVGRVVVSSPDLASMNANHLAVFARGIESALWFSETTTPTNSGEIWAPWQSLGGLITSDSGAVSWGDGRLDVFARGADGALWHIWREGSDWSSWESLGGRIKGGPDVCSWAPGRLDVFARGEDDVLRHIWFDGGWSAWESLGGGQLTSDPSAVSWGQGRIDVFGRGTDLRLYHRWFDGVWSGWEGLGGVLASGPDVASWGPDRLDVFVRGTDRQLWQLTFNGNWQPWTPLGGSLITDPSAVALAPDRMTVMVVGEDMGLWVKHFS